MPQPITTTESPADSSARRAAQTTVAVAQFAGAATAAGRDSGTVTSPVPPTRWQWVAKQPLSPQWPVMASCPYLRTAVHFCGTPRRHRRQEPQEVPMVHVTRPPGSTSRPSTVRTEPATSSTIPTASWPRTVGVGVGRSPERVCRSLPQMVASSMRTSTSPGASSGRGRG